MRYDVSVVKKHGGFGMEGVSTIIVAQAILFLIPAWRIFARAGLDSALALVVLIPYAGLLIAMAILAAADWPRNRGAGDPERGDI